ncbi:cytochrome c biogenesis protein ResB [Propionibacterium australiense]|uniref:Cytochrome c biogenesis protein n=1 Tax=Propionibacterium australiense TaxID=119981 RepID=A0A8B3FRI5_9ACTN|nr:cytochrome c biogenesis protein ResB [Propionibacterium australiense]RLP08836.1 cytochrome c biogenesis protein [Propionibacterium australiense]
MTTPADEYDETPQIGVGDFFAAIYRFLHSKKVGLALILAMGVLSLLGILIEQADSTVRSDPDMYAAWLEQARSRYGGWTSVLDAIGFFHMFSSPLYIAVLALLTLSIIACTVHRIPVLWKNAAHPKTRVTTGFYSRARTRAQAVSPLGTGEAHEQVRTMLSKAHFRVLSDPERSDQIYADRFRFAPFGTVFAHTAFIIILIGFTLTGAAGFQDEDVTVPLESRVAVGHDTGLEVELISFEDSYYADGSPKDYVSDLAVYRDGQQVARQMVRVNHPLTVDEVAFNQSYFGVAADVTIADADGSEITTQVVPLQWSTDDGQNAYGMVTLPEQHLDVYVMTAASGANASQLAPGEARIEVYGEGQQTLRGTGTIQQGTQGTVGGLKFTFNREKSYTGLLVARDPGAVWVWIGSGLLLAGICMTMLARHRRVWVRISESSEGGSLVQFACPDRHDTSFENLLNRMAASLADTAEEGADNA